jgi:hypothetical protein
MSKEIIGIFGSKLIMRKTILTSKGDVDVCV